MTLIEIANRSEPTILYLPEGIFEDREDISLEKAMKTISDGDGGYNVGNTIYATWSLLDKNMVIEIPLFDGECGSKIYVPVSLVHNLLKRYSIYLTNWEFIRERILYIYLSEDLAKYMQYQFKGYVNTSPAYYINTISCSRSSAITITAVNKPVHYIQTYISTGLKSKRQGEMKFKDTAFIICNTKDQPNDIFSKLEVNGTMYARIKDALEKNNIDIDVDLNCIVGKTFQIEYHPENKKPNYIIDVL